MNLNYSILWFDDQEDFVASLDLAPLHQEIASWGFKSNIDHVYDDAEFLKHAPFTHYDLIVLDFSLEGMDSGDTFIQKIREHDIYTEIIFYSANRASDLWAAIGQKQLEGIFVANKSNITQKIVRVANQSVRKVLDLENMRGIVMSEVGDLDILLDGIFSSALSDLEEPHQKDIFSRFHEGASRQAASNKEALDAFIGAPTLDALKQLCDSDKRWQNFKRAQRHHHELKKADSIGDYTVEILGPRNFLAHGAPTRQPDGSYEFSYRNKTYLFNEKASQELRQRILHYKTIFSEIIESLKNKSKQ